MHAIHPIGPEQAPLLMRDYYANGDPGSIVGALAYIPELAEVALPFLGAALGASAVSERLKEIAILRTSARMSCRFCTASHTVVAAEAGLTHEEVEQLRCEREDIELFVEPGERALIAWIDGLTAGPGPVAPEVLAELQEHFPDHVIVELTITIGATMMLNRLATGLSLPSSEETLDRLDELDFAHIFIHESEVAIGGPTS